MKEIRVVHIPPGLALQDGGPTRAILSLCLAQTALGADVTVLAGRPWDRGAVEQEVQGVRILSAPFLLGRFQIPSRRFLSELARLLPRVDVVHLHGLWNGTTPAAAALSRRAGVPYVVSPHGMLDRANVRNRGLMKPLYYALVERHTLGKAAGWHFLNSGERKGCWARQRPEQLVLVAPNAIDVGAIRAALDSMATPERQSVPTLVFLGRLHPIKGLEIQIETLALLKARGFRARLRLIGPDSGAGVRIRELAESLGVSGDVDIPGPIYSDERLAVLRDADAVLLTSHYECFSVTAVETMAVGGALLATVACNLEGPAAAGAVVTVPRTTQALADAIVDLCSDHESTQQLRDAATRYAVENLDGRRTANRVLSFYAEAAALV